LSNIPFPKVIIIAFHASPDLEEVIDIFRIFQFIYVKAWNFPLELEELFSLDIKRFIYPVDLPTSSYFLC
jgi:hypothetical protein